jgi:hypothetical protein
MYNCEKARFLWRICVDKRTKARFSAVFCTFLEADRANRWEISHPEDLRAPSAEPPGRALWPAERALEYFDLSLYAAGGIVSRHTIEALGCRSRLLCVAGPFRAAPAARDAGSRTRNRA